MTVLGDRGGDLERGNAELRRRLEEAPSQLTATIEILQVRANSRINCVMQRMTIY